MLDDRTFAERLAALETCVHALRDDVRGLRAEVHALTNEALARDVAAKERDRLTRMGIKTFAYLMSLAVILGSITVWVIERADQVRALIVGPPK